MMMDPWELCLSYHSQCDYFPHKFLSTPSTKNDFIHLKPVKRWGWVSQEIKSRIWDALKVFMASPAHVNFIAYLYTTGFFRKMAKQPAVRRKLPPLSLSLFVSTKAHFKFYDSDLKDIDSSFSKDLTIQTNLVRHNCLIHLKWPRDWWNQMSYNNWT